MDPVERIYREWDERLAQKDVEGILALYAVDAVFESPLVPHLMGVERGILRGHEQLRAFFQELAQRKPVVRGRYRAGYLSDGRQLVWEYPRAAPEAEQMDLAEFMEIGADGLITRQRVYWGWFALAVLQKGEYRR